jgi:hypothetical protein
MSVVPANGVPLFAWVTNLNQLYLQTVPLVIWIVVSIAILALFGLGCIVVYGCSSKDMRSRLGSLFSGSVVAILIRSSQVAVYGVTVGGAYEVAFLSGQRMNLIHIIAVALVRPCCYTLAMNVPPCLGINLFRTIGPFRFSHFLVCVLARIGQCASSPVCAPSLPSPLQPDPSIRQGCIWRST